MPPIDLHGLTPSEALRAFAREYNRQVRQGQLDTITVVHGYGSTGTGGEIKASLHRFLAKHQDALDWLPGDGAAGGNPGQTIVRPLAPLPEEPKTQDDLLVEFCEVAKPEQKILTKFFKTPPNEIKAALRRLKAAGRLVEATKNGKTTYEAKKS